MSRLVPEDILLPNATETEGRAAYLRTITVLYMKCHMRVKLAGLWGRMIPPRNGHTTIMR
jgi:hypothetical protein